MSAPKKAPHKSPKHAPDKAIKDERRAYEHLSRVEGLHRHLDKGAAQDITKLVAIARHELESGHMKDAADLLRAAEHLSFGSFHDSKKQDAHPKLAEEFKHEFQEKLKKAEEHWSVDEAHPESVEIYASTQKRAQKAFDEGSYPAALELARGVEALAHVETHDDEESDDAESQK